MSTHSHSSADFPRLLLCMLALLLAAKELRAATFYVANGGNDASAGTSPATAWRTLARANRWLPTAHAGDRLLLHGGDTFRDDYLRCSEPDGQSACGGSIGRPIVVGSYGTRRPLIDGADPLQLPWRPLSPGVFSASLPRTPSKLYVDPLDLGKAQLLPVPNASGAYDPGRTYKFLDLVTQNNSVYVHGSIKPSAGQAPEDDQVWVRVGHSGAPGQPQSFSPQASGPDNVRAIPGSWYTDGSTLYVHLTDGSNPSAHTMEGTYRPYGVLLVSARNITVQDIGFAHQGQSSIFAVAYGEGGNNTGASPDENIHLVHNTCSHFGQLVTARFPLHRGANYLQGCIVVTASGDCQPHLLRGLLIDGNDVGTYDGYLGTGQFHEAGILVSGADGGGPANANVIVNNKVHTHATRGIVYGNQGLDSCGGGEVRNNGGTVANNELTDNQGNLFFTQTVGGRVTGNTIHHSFGEGVQSGGNSQSPPSQPQVFDHNLIAFLGRSADGALYNGFDCNGSPGGVTGATWRNNTVYNTDAAAITLEHGCGDAHVENNIFDMHAPRFPAHDQMNASYLFYFQEESHTPGAVFRNNLWVDGSNPKPFHGTGSSYTCADFFNAWPDRSSLCAPDAGFTDAEHGNFHLSPSSPARGKATDGGSLGALP